RQIIPVGSGETGFYTPQDALKREKDKSIQSEKSELPVTIGDISVEENQDIQLLSETENEVVIESNDGERVVITQGATENGIIIEYGGKKITLDPSIEIGEIVVNEDGSGAITFENGAVLTASSEGITIECQGTTINIDKSVDIGKIEVLDKFGILVYDKDGVFIVGVAEVGSGSVKIGEMYVDYYKGVTVTISGDEQGRVNAVEVTTEAGSYTTEKTDDGNIQIATPSGDVTTLNFNQEVTNSQFYIHPTGEGTIYYHLSEGRNVRVEVDSEGKVASAILYKSRGWTNTVNLQRGEEGVDLNLTVNGNGSVTIDSDAENSIQLKFNWDRTVEAIRPDGTILPITGEIETATFNEDGGVTIEFKDGTTTTIKIDWWDGKTSDEIASYLEELINQGELDEATQRFQELAEADIDLATQVIESMNVNEAALIIEKIAIKDAARILGKMGNQQKAASILTTMNQANHRQVVDILAAMAADGKSVESLIQAIGITSFTPQDLAQITSQMDKSDATDFLLFLRDYSVSDRRLYPTSQQKLFAETFGALCEINAALAAEVFNDDFGISDWEERFFMINILLFRRGMTLDQISLLLSAKDDEGNYIISTDKAVDFFHNWSRSDGGQRPWDKAIVVFIECGRAGELLSKMDEMFDGEREKNEVIDWLPSLKRQFFLSLIDVIQSGNFPDAKEVLNECIKQGIFSLDPDVDLTITRTEDEWKQIALNSNNEYTRAAALSQITDEAWLKDYVFNIDSQKGLVFDLNVSDIEFAAILRTGQTSSWYAQLTDKNERRYYITKILEADTTDVKPYIWSGEADKWWSFMCWDFTAQLYMNGRGFGSEFKYSQEVFENYGFNVPQEPYNIPIYCVYFEYGDGSYGHMVNAVFIGDDINDPTQVKNWDNWVFIDPITDGTPNMPPGTHVEIGLPTKIGPGGFYWTNTLVEFLIESDGSGSVVE
ncbi:MAG: hypothetical protein DRP81_08050, partial [Candidatus Omnitrophota bacterium]